MQETDVQTLGGTVRHEKSVELLNRAVSEELQAVHQYMYFHFHCDDQGYDLLANLFRRTAIEEMQHIEILAERILFLKGDVEMVVAGDVKQVNDVKAMLEMGMEMEEESALHYNQWANECSQNADSASKQIFENLVADEERHYDQYEVQLEHMGKFGKKSISRCSPSNAAVSSVPIPVVAGLVPDGLTYLKSFKPHGLPWGFYFSWMSIVSRECRQCEKMILC